MNPKPKYLYALAAILMLCGCGEYKPKQRVESINSDANLGIVWIDTIQIHGNIHEILVRDKTYGKGGVGGMMHSPECWCGKGGGE